MFYTKVFLSFLITILEEGMSAGIAAIHKPAETPHRTHRWDSFLSRLFQQSGINVISVLQLVLRGLNERVGPIHFALASFLLCHDIAETDHNVGTLVIALKPNRLVGNTRNAKIYLRD